MSTDELDALLNRERTCRIATCSARGPHVSPVWFVWDGASIWISSITRSQRWVDIERDNRVAVVVDAGREFFDLHGAELSGEIHVVGAVPRSGDPNPQLATPERLFARKYLGVDEMAHDGRHAWLRLTPRKIISWDFRKLAA